MSRLHIDFWNLTLANPQINARFGGMYHSFFQGLERAGMRVTLNALPPDGKADVLVVPVGGRQDQTSAQAIHSLGKPVVLYAPPGLKWFRGGFLKRWRDYILFAYGTDFSNLSRSLYQSVGIQYYNLPLASDPAVMRPLDLPKLYDVVFVGGSGSGTGRQRYIETLIKADRKLRILLIGPGWERYGYPFQCVAWGGLLNEIYNMARVCINIHNDEQKAGVDKRLDANNRLFDLAMAGCFQISNAPQTVRAYFDDSEVPTYDDPEEWLSAILYYLQHPIKAREYQLAARSRALAEHTWDHRAKRFIKLIRSSLERWEKKPQTASLWLSTSRYRDTALPPYDISDLVHRKGARFLRRIGWIRRLRRHAPNKVDGRP